MAVNSLVSYLTSIFRTPALNVDHFIVYGFVLFSLALTAWWIIDSLRHRRLLKPLGTLIAIIIAFFAFHEVTNMYIDLMTLQTMITGGIPYNVESQYVHTEPGPSTWGVYLDKCLRDNKVAYRLILGGGGDAEEYYFNALGTSLGTFHDTDVHIGNYQGPPVSLSDCHTIKEKQWQLKR